MADLSPERWQWHKSSFSGANGCVEVALVEGGAAVRDSKDPASPVLRFTAREWEAFLAGVRAGEFDLTVAGQAGGDDGGQVAALAALASAHLARS
jgi:hypothetical protein